MTETVSVAQFAQGFLDLDGRRAQHVDIGGDIPLAVRGRPARGANAMVVLFHGAVDRAVRAYPSFLGYRRGIHPYAHQLAIADPSLTLSDAITSAWFVGSEGTPLQTLLPSVLRQLAETLAVTKIVLVGSSAGGFAALYYSWHLPGSTAVVSVPQTNIRAYYGPRRDPYLKYAWPSRDSESNTCTPCLDLRDIYRKGMDNTIVYLQGNLDQFHLRNHMVPFIDCMPPAMDKHVALNCSFWGKVGHGGAVPSGVMDEWVRAALMAPENSAEAIVLAHEKSGRIEAGPRDEAVANGPKTGNRGHNEPETYAPRDVELASQLAAELLKNRSHGAKPGV